MFKVLKYLFLANLYNRAKKSFITLLISIISLVVLSLMMNDAINVATGMSVYLLLLLKWIIILSLLGLIGYNILKIINSVMTPFNTEKETQTNDEEVVDTKKNRILSKDKLYTKSDLILQKYTKDL